MTYPPLNQPNPRSGRGWFIVLGAVVLGVFIFCGIVVAAAGSKDPNDTRDVSRTGALSIPQTSPVPAAETATATATSEPATTPPTTEPPATTAPTTTPATQTTTKAPTTKTTTRAPTKQPTKAPTTKPAGNCNPNYSPCVPNDPVDVDCKGGSGNGPSYVQGPVRVIGRDVYGLDSNNDGIGCE